MLAHVAAALALGHVHVQALAVDVPHEELAVILLGPAPAEIAHEARVRVTAARRVGTRVAAVRRPAEVVAVVGDGLEVVVDKRVDGLLAGLGEILREVIRRDASRLLEARRVVLAALPLVAPALNHVEEVRDDARLDEELPVLVEVQPPRIARALGEDLEAFLHRLIAPHAGVDELPLGVRRTGDFHMRVGEHAVAAVEPAVRTPAEGVEHLVRVLPREAFEQLHRLTGGLRAFVRFLHGDVQEPRRSPDEHAAEAILDAAGEVQSFVKHRALVELVVPVRVLEDEDAVGALALGLALRVGVVLDDPEPPAVINAEGDRLLHVGFGGEDVQLEARRERRGLHHFRSGEAGKLHVVGRERVGLGRAFCGSHGSERGLLLVELEVIEVHVAPAARLLVHEADENLLAHLRRQIHDHG